MTLITPQTPYGYTIFCDDVRHEVSGKFTFVGVYQAEMIVSGTLPAQLPKFVLCINYREKPGESTENVQLQIYMPEDSSDSPSMKLDVPVEHFRQAATEPLNLIDAESSPIISGQFIVEIVPLKIKKEGHIKVRALRGEAKYALGALLIKASQRDSTDPAASVVQLAPQG